MSITPERKKELRELCEKATPGPYSFEKDGRSFTPNGSIWFGEDGGYHSFMQLCVDDLHYIVAAMNAVPRLLDALEESERDPGTAKIPTDVTKGEAGKPLPACPRCGGKLERDKVHYECRSWRTLTGGIVHTYMCDRNAALQSENAVLRERLAKIEKAARECAEWAVGFCHEGRNDKTGEYDTICCSGGSHDRGEWEAFEESVDALRAALEKTP